MSYADDFNRGSLGTTAPNGATYEGDGSWSITANQVVSPSGTYQTLVLDTQRADGSVSALMVTDPDNTAGVVCRWADADNFVEMVYDPNAVGGTMYLRKVVAGVESLFDEYSGVGSLAGAVFTLIFDGPDYDLLIDSVSLFTYHDSGGVLLGNTRHGLIANDSVQTFDDLSIDGTYEVAVSAGSETLTGGTFDITAPVPQVITVAGLARGRAIGRCRVSHAGEAVPRGLQTKVFRPPNFRTPVHEIVQDPTARSGAWNRQWQNRLNDRGSGKLTVLNSGPDRDEITGGDLIRFELDGETVTAFLVDPQESHTIPAGGAQAADTTISGQGLLSYLSHAVVLPPLGFDRVPVEIDRTFAWPSTAFPDRSWGHAHEIMFIATANNGNTSTGWPWQPVGGDGFPNLAMIGPHDGTNQTAHIGSCFFRYHFTVATAGNYVALMAADDIGWLYLDGGLICSTTKIDQTSVRAMYLSAGEHVFAARVQNVLNPADAPPYEAFNPMHLTVGLYPADPSGKPTSATPVAQTSDDWLIVEFPPFPPAMTIGEIILQVLGEAQDQGWLTGVTPSFDEHNDSDGIPWATPDGEISTKIGRDLASFLVDELAGTFVDIRMWPGTLVLDAYNLDGLGSAVDLELASPTDLDDPTSGNLTELTHTRVDVKANQLLVQYQGGWRLVGDPGGEKKVMPLGLGSFTSAAVVDQVANNELARYSRTREQIIAGTRPETILGVVEVGDTITVPGYDGASSAERLIGITVTEDENGVLAVTPELKDLLRQSDERHELWLSKMANGAADGTSGVAQPIDTSPVAGPTCCAPPVPEGDT